MPDNTVPNSTLQGATFQKGAIARNEIRVTAQHGNMYTLGKKKKKKAKKKASQDLYKIVWTKFQCYIHAIVPPVAQCPLTSHWRKLLY